MGGGYIGTELAQILHAFGAKTQILTNSRILRAFDEETGMQLQRFLEDEGTPVNQGFVSSVERNPDGSTGGALKIHTNKGYSLEADMALLVAGRTPNTGKLGLENTEVKLLKNGAVEVDEFENSTAKGIYALGDVNNKLNLTPVAVRAGRILAERLFGEREGLKMDYENVATVIFSHPPMGSVGLSEEDAAKKHGADQLSIYRGSFVPLFYTMAEERLKQKTFMKIVCAKEQGGVERVVGVHAVGRCVDEMMQGIAGAVKMGATKQDFDNVVAIHPTSSEEFVLFDPKFT